VRNAEPRPFDEKSTFVALRRRFIGIVSWSESVNDWAVKILFVCSRNKWRSLTAEKIYQKFAGYSVRSAGTEKGARIKITECHIGWSDWIFCMEKKHVDRLRTKFGTTLDGKNIVCLHIPDDYEFMDPKVDRSVEIQTQRIYRGPGG